VADLLFLATIVAFFALMVVFVRVCERVVGKDDAVGPGFDPDAPDTAPDANDATVIEEVPA
jgi:hypothetical protein